MSYIAEGDGPDLHPEEPCEKIPPTVVVFHGSPSVFFIAICEDCDGNNRARPMPFDSAEARDRWVEGHRTVHKNIKLAVEVRP